jgi:hypothetical protein
MHAQHDDGDRRIFLRNLNARLDPIQVRHTYVEHNDIGFGRGSIPYRFPPIVGLGDYGHVRLSFQQKTQAAAQQLVIICEEYSKFPHVVWQ